MLMAYASIMLLEQTIDKVVMQLLNIAISQIGHTFPQTTEEE